jgi:hypothetical protein
VTGGCSPGGGASGDWSRLAAGAGSARDGAGFWIGWGDVGGAGLGGAGASGAAEAWAARGGVSLPEPEVRSGTEGGPGCPGPEPWPGGRIGAEGWTESSRHSQTPRAGSSRRGVNAAGVRGASAGREADVGTGAWAVAGAWAPGDAGAGA